MDTVSQLNVERHKCSKRMKLDRVVDYNPHVSFS